MYRAYGHVLGAKPLKTFSAYLADGVFALHTTDVTLREIRQQIDLMQTELVTEANRSARLIERWNRRFRHDFSQISVPPQLELPVSPSKAYQDFEYTLLHEWKAERHDASSLPMGAVLDQYFLRQPPFDKDGSKEFPDAMALLALEAWCQKTKEKCYVVTKDKAVQRAAEKSDNLIPIGSLNELLSLLTTTLDHQIVGEIEAAVFRAPLFDEIEAAFSNNMAQFGGIYDGDRTDGEVHGIEFLALNTVSSVSVLRVENSKVACVLSVGIDV